MEKSNEKLMDSIASLMAAWRKENGIKEGVLIQFVEDNDGYAYSLEDGRNMIRGKKFYGKTETPGAATPRESK